MTQLKAQDSRLKAGSGLDVVLGVLDVPAWRRWVEPVVGRCTPLSRDQEPLLRLAEALADRRDAARDAGTEPDASLQALGAAAETLLVYVERVEDRGVAVTRRADEDSAEGLVYRRLRGALLAALVEHSTALSGLLDGEAQAARLAGASLRTRRSRLLYWLVTVSVPVLRRQRTLVAPHRYMPVLLDAEGRDPLLSLLRGRWSQWPSFRPDQALALGGLPERRLESVPLADWVVAGPERVALIASQLRAQLRRFVHLEWLRRSAPALHTALLAAWEPALDATLLRDYESVISSCPWDADHAACWRYLHGEHARAPVPCPAPWLELGDEARAQVQAHGVLELLRELLHVVQAAERQQAGLYALFV